MLLCENGKTNEYVAVYITTPYGVTNHLHIPAYRPALTPAAKDQIKQAVDDVIKGYKLPPHEVTMSAADDKNKVLNLIATCLDDSCTDFKFKVDHGAGINVQYTYKTEPRLTGQHVTFYAVPFFNDRFFGQPVSVAEFNPIQPTEAFSATGDRGAEESLMDEIGGSQGISSKDFANGAVQLKLVYYMEVNGGLKERLLDEIDVTATLQHKKAPEPTPPAPNPSAGAPAAAPASDQKKDATPSTAQPGLPLPPPAAKPTDNQGARSCPCGLNGSDSSIRLASDNEPLGPRQIPARFAALDNATSLPLKDTIEDAAVLPDGASQRLSDIEAKLEQIAQKQTELRTALANGGGVANLPPGVGMSAGQSVVNVHINQAPNSSVRLCDEKKWPRMHELCVRARECWHNVRDEFPGG